MHLHDTIYESKDATKYYATSFYTTIQYKATSAVYVALYNTTTLWHTIGLIWVVMGCYVRKPKFADAIRPNHDRPPPTGCNAHYTGPNDGSCHLGPMSYFNFRFYFITITAMISSFATSVIFFSSFFVINN